MEIEFFELLSHPQRLLKGKMVGKFTGSAAGDGIASIGVVVEVPDEGTFKVQTGDSLRGVYDEKHHTGWKWR